MTSFKQVFFAGFVAVSLLYARSIDKIFTPSMMEELRAGGYVPESRSLEERHLSAHYSSLKEQDEREYRFPSIEDRVKFYMASWYVPPCPSNHEAMAAYRRLGSNSFLVREISTEQPPRTFILRTQSQNNRVFALDPDTLHSRCHRKYCGDSLIYLAPALRRVAKE